MKLNLIQTIMFRGYAKKGLLGTMAGWIRSLQELDFIFVRPY